MMEPLSADEMRQTYARAILGSLNEIMAAAAGTSSPAHAIIAAVAIEFNCTVAEILGPTRGPDHVAQARMEAYLRIRETLHYSFSRIARIFGRHHTTVMYGIRVARKRRAA